VKFACTLGCKDRFGRPEVHPSKRLCPIYRGMQIEAKTKAAQRPNPPPRAPPSPAPTPVLGPAPAAPSPPPGAWGVTYRPATATDASAANAPIPSSMEWEVSVETSERFWTNILTVIFMIVDFVCRVFAIPELPPEVTSVDEGQKFVFRTALRPTAGQFLKKLMGAKSPEQADMIVSGMSGVIGFGQTGAKIALHFWKHLPESPKWKAFRARVKRGRGRGEEEEGAPARPQRPTGRPAPSAPKEPVEADFTDVPPPTAPVRVPAGAMGT
jgi:hypothetical protein